MLEFNLVGCFSYVILAEFIAGVNLLLHEIMRVWMLLCLTSEVHRRISNSI